jgi:hypothetical protein
MPRTIRKTLSQGGGNPAEEGGGPCRYAPDSARRRRHLEVTRRRPAGRGGPGPLHEVHVLVLVLLERSEAAQNEPEITEIPGTLRAAPAERSVHRSRTTVTETRTRGTVRSSCVRAASRAVKQAGNQSSSLRAGTTTAMWPGITAGAHDGPRRVPVRARGSRENLLGVERERLQPGAPTATRCTSASVGLPCVVG